MVSGITVTPSGSSDESNTAHSVAIEIEKYSFLGRLGRGKGRK